MADNVISIVRSIIPTSVYDTLDLPKFKKRRAERKRKKNNERVVRMMREVQNAK